jgi:O-antigen ligase
MQHPNGEGIECGILVLSGIAGSRVDRQRLWIYRSVGCVAVVFLLLTDSRTSVIATLAAVAVYWTMSSSRRSGKAIVVSAIVLTVLIVVSLVTGLMPVINNALSVQRDEGAGAESFGGRTQIWEDVTAYIMKRPLIGHGYGGFWTPEHISAISDEEKWGVPDSHSAYVDYLLTIGAVGLALYLGCLVQGLWKSVAMSRGPESKDTAFLTGILIFGAIDGFFESSIGEGSLLMFLCIIALAWLAFVPAPEPKALVPKLVYKQEVLAQQ